MGDEVINVPQILKGIKSTQHLGHTSPENISNLSPAEINPVDLSVWKEIVCGAMENIADNGVSITLLLTDPDYNPALIAISAADSVDGVAITEAQVTERENKIGEVDLFLYRVLFGSMDKYWQRLVLKCRRQPGNTKSGQSIIHYLETEIGADNTGYLQAKKTELENIRLEFGYHPRYCMNCFDEGITVLTSQENKLFEHCGEKEFYYQLIMSLLKDNSAWDIYLENRQDELLKLSSARAMRVDVINYASKNLAKHALKPQTEEFPSSTFSTNSSSGNNKNSDHCTNVNCTKPNTHVFDDCRFEGGGSEQSCSWCKAKKFKFFGHTADICFRKKNQNSIWWKGWRQRWRQR